MKKTGKRILCLLLGASMLLSLAPAQGFAAEKSEGQGKAEGIGTLTVHYEADGEPLRPDYSATLQIGSGFQVDSPQVEGYMPETKTVEGTLTEDMEITVNYVRTGKMAGYTIRYVGRSAEGEETVLETVEDEAQAGSVISAEEKVFDGYIREAGQMDLTVTADGKATLNVYYTKKVNPCIIFNTGGSYVAPVSAAPGSDISEQMAEVSAEENAPSKQGYVFAGWDTPLPETMPEKDLTVNAKWAPGTSDYTVLFWLENRDGTGYDAVESRDDIREAETDSKVNITDADKRMDKADAGESDCDTDSPFFGFDYSHADEDVTVTADGEAVLNVYYDRETWSIILYKEKLDTTGNTEYTEWKHLSGKYGTRISEEELSRDIASEYYGDLFNGEFFVQFELASGVYSFPTLFIAENAVMDPEDRAAHQVKYYPYMSTSEPVIYHYDYYRESLEEGVFEHSTSNESIHDKKSLGMWTVMSGVGFTWYGGYWKQGDTEDEALASEEKLTPYTSKKAPDFGTFTSQGSNQTAYIFTYRVENGKYYSNLLDYWTLLYVKRVRSTVYYISNGKEYSKEENVPYEREVNLTVTPDDGGEGKVFDGWYLTPDFTGEKLESCTMPAENLYLYAKWKDTPCTVEFDTRGGSETAGQTVERNGKAVQPEDPVRDGFVFAGWFDEDGVRWSFDREITQDTTIYAWWTPVEVPAEYTVHHRMSGEETDFYTETGDGRMGDSVAVKPLARADEHFPEGAYALDRAVRSIVLAGDQNETVYYYDKPEPVSYVVHYYYEGTEDSLLPDKEVTDVYFSFVTEMAEQAEGMEVIGSRYGTADLAAGEREIVFYYKTEDTIPDPGTPGEADGSDKTEPPAKTDGGSPETGDHAGFQALWVLLCAVSGVGLTLVGRKRRG